MFEGGNDMIHLLRLELVKLKRSIFSIILLFLVLIVLGSYFFYIAQKEMSLQEMKENVQINLEENKDGYESTKAEIEASEGNVSPDLEYMFNFYERQYNSYLLMHEGINSGNWTIYSRGEIDFHIGFEENKKKELEQVAKSYTWPTPFTVLSELDRIRWMEERNVQPIFPLFTSTWMSIYDEEFTDPTLEKIVTRESDKYSASGFHFTYEVLKYSFSIFGVIFFVFFFGDILTREGFGKNGPIHMLRTQPIRRWEFWLSKGITVIVGSLLIILGVVLVGLALGVIFNRLGDWDYPILIYGPERTYSFLPLAVFVGKALGLFLLMLGLGFSLLFLFSVLTNRAILAIGLTLVALFGGQMLTEQSMLLSWSHWLPFHYFDVYAILTREYAVLQENYLYTYTAGIISLSVTTVIILLLTFGLGKIRKGVIS